MLLNMTETVQKQLTDISDWSFIFIFNPYYLGRQTFRKTQLNLDFSKQGGAGGLGDLPIQIFYMVMKNPDFWGRGGSRTVHI